MAKPSRSLGRGPLHDYVAQLVSGLQVVRHNLHSNAAARSECLSRQMPEILEAPASCDLSFIDAPPASASCAFVSWEAEKLSSRIGVFIEQLVADPDMQAALMPPAKLGALEDKPARNASSPKPGPRRQASHESPKKRNDDDRAESPKKRARADAAKDALHPAKAALSAATPVRPTASATLPRPLVGERLQTPVGGGRDDNVKDHKPRAIGAPTTGSAAPSPAASRGSTPGKTRGNNVQALLKKFEATAGISASTSASTSSHSDKSRAFPQKQAAAPSAQVRPSALAASSARSSGEAPPSSSRAQDAAAPAPVSAPNASATGIPRPAGGASRARMRSGCIPDVELPAQVDVEALVAHDAEIAGPTASTVAPVIVDTAPAVEPDVSVVSVAQAPAQTKAAAVAQPARQEVAEVASARSTEPAPLTASASASSLTIDGLPSVAMPARQGAMVRAAAGTSSAPAFTNIAALALQQAEFRGMDSRRGEPRAAGGSDVYERLTEGRRRDDIEKPKSLRMAEQSKLQEERRLREKQQDRDREKAKAVTGHHVTSTASAATSAVGGAEFLGVVSDPGSAKPAKGKGKGRANRRSATCAMPPGASAPAEAPAPVATERPAAAVPALELGSLQALGAPEVLGEIQAGPPSTGATPNCTPRKPLPKVPIFKEPEPWQVLRQTELPSPRPEDNYEISDQGDDSEPDDEAEARRRAKKTVPKWCGNYLELLQKQANTDPDTIFGSKVPHCSLDDVFRNEHYELAKKKRPKRNRGSSGDWRKDTLSKNEVKNYKQKMGQVKGWMTNLENMPPANQELLAGPPRRAA